MTRRLSYKRPVSIEGTQQKLNKFNPAPELETYHGATRPSNSGRQKRSIGVLLPGLLMAVVIGAVLLAVPATTQAGEISIGISVRIGPPPLPVYVQPVCPGPDYIWTPGYWAYDPENGYFWVPGTWVLAPAPGLLWTPGYWGWGGAAFIWHAGYWGPHVGFYGGINYGFGYNGRGFEGGEWRGQTFFYNRSVTNVNVTNVTNVYNRTVVNNFAINRISYNGGSGGLSARPTPAELSAEHDRHIEATSMQRQQEGAAHNNRLQFASVNHGAPSVAATGRPGDFAGTGVVHSTRAGGVVNPETFHGTNPGHSNTFQSTRSPNPGGGGTRALMTTHSNAPVSHNAGTTTAGRPGSEYHSSPTSRYEAPRASTAPAHNAPSHNTSPAHQAAAPPRQSNEHSSKPAGGGNDKDKRDSEPRR